VSGRQRGTRHLHSNVRLLSTFRRCKKSCAPELPWSRLSQKSYSAGTSVYRTLVEMLLAQARSCRYGRCRHKEGDALNAFNNVKRHLLGPRERSATMSALSHPAKQWNRIRPWTCQRHRLRVLHHVVHQPSRRPSSTRLDARITQEEHIFTVTVRLITADRVRGHGEKRSPPRLIRPAG
jgi:hypothetical protein